MKDAVNPIEQLEAGKAMTADGHKAQATPGASLLNEKIPVTSDPAGLTQAVAASGVPQVVLPTQSFERTPEPR